MLHKGWLRHRDFMLVDLASLEVSLFMALQFCRWILKYDLTRDWPLFLFFPMIFFLSGLVLDTYNGILQRGYIKELLSLLKLDILTFGLLIFCFYYLELYQELPKKSLLICFSFFLPVAYIWRFIHKFVLRRHYARIKNSRQIVVAITEKAAEEMIRTITESAIRNYQFFGLVVLDRSMIGEMIGNVRVAADKDTLIEYVQTHIVDEVLINIPDDSAQTFRLAQELLDMGITVHIYMENAYQTLPNRCISNVFGYNVLTTTISPISFRQMLMKRFFDLCGGIVGCLITMVLTVIIGPIIFIKSPGPIFFSQVRIGKKGRPFRIFKFRSMYMDAEARKQELMAQNKIQDGFMFKLDDDPRIIKGIGTFIRKTSLDEFPQFFNVLKGDMSMVGTRPPTADEYAIYSPHHKRRLSTLPGITGLWQVSGRSEITDFEEVIKLDTEYIENWSLELDAKIIFKTITKIWNNQEAS